MSLSQVIIDAIQRSKPALGDLVVNGTLKQSQGNVYNDTTGVNAPTTKDLSFDFVYESVSVDEVRELSLKSTDQKIIMLDVPAVPTNADKITIGPDTFNVLKAYPVQAGLFPAICTVFIRK